MFVKNVLVLSCLLMGITGAYAGDELDPSAIQGIVIKLDRETKSTTIFKLNSAVIVNGEFSKEKASALADSGALEEDVISNVIFNNLENADELDLENSEGNFYYYGYFRPWNRGWNRGWNRRSYFRYNNYNYGYRYNYNCNFNYRRYSYYYYY